MRVITPVPDEDLPDDAEVLELLTRARQDVLDLRAQGLTSVEVVAKLDMDFERAAKAALRRPNPLQRSRVLRAVVRRVIPNSLRPLIKRLIRRPRTASMLR